MINPLLINLETLIDDAKCFETLHQLRWPQGVDCYDCQSSEIVKRRFDETQPLRQRYKCRVCNKRFDDLNDIIFCWSSSTLADLDFMFIPIEIESV